MALKKMAEITESFPKLKRARLGAAPPNDDVLDNVGIPDEPVATAQQHVTVEAASTPSEGTDDAPRGKATKKRESGAKRVGQGVHKGSGTDARRYRKTGRMYQFGARVKPDFAESVKVIAAANNVTIGELLEEMEKVYTGLKVVAADKKMSIAAVLDDLLKVCKVA